MNTLSAREIKRRGVKAIELALKDGPVHIIKNNTPTCVVISETQYARLKTRHPCNETKDTNLLKWLLNKKAGGKTREVLDNYLTAERNEWD